jgi:hypothetical protein
MGVPSTSPKRPSTLNNDGSPLQICVTLARGKRHQVRLLADPASAGMSPGQCRLAARRAVSTLLSLRAPELRPVCDITLNHALPSDTQELASLPGAGFWIASNVAGPGVAVYATAKWGSHSARWSRARNWLRAILKNYDDFEVIFDRLSTSAALVSIGFEGHTIPGAYVKVYWHLDGRIPLNRLGIHLLDNCGFLDFLKWTIINQRISFETIVGSVGFDVESGRLADVKLDICAHCLRKSSTQWINTLRSYAGRYGLTDLAVQDWELFEGLEMAFVGLGINASQIPRLNMYLKACGPQ